MAPQRVIYSVLFFVLIMSLVIISKPSLLFDSDHTLRPFGVGMTNGERPTLFPLGVVTAITAVASMFIFTLIDVLYAG